MNYLTLLSEQGDPIEMRGVHECNLGEKFSRYAEFWSKYVLPNRDPSDHSKFRHGFPKEIEFICNNHYTVFYHLTYAYLQINFLKNSPSAANTILDIGNPLYHLVTASDLVERTFISVFRVNNLLSIDKINPEEFEKVVAEIWESYDKSFLKFQATYKPIAINLHNITLLFKQLLKENLAVKGYRTASKELREYRNIFTHGLSPLRLIRNGVTYLPRLEFLDNYDEGYWSAERHNINYEEYAPALEIIPELGDKMIYYINESWEILLNEMSKVFDKYMQSNVSDSIKYPYDSSAQMQNSDYPYAGGTLTYPAPPVNPSGYKPDNTNDPFQVT